MKFIIDTVIKNPKKKMLILKGWGINKEENEALKIKVEDNKNIASTLVNYSFRGDVAQIFKLPPECSCGFIIAVKLHDYLGKVAITFYDDTDAKKKVYSVKESFLGEEREKTLQAYYILAQRGIRYVKGTGLRNVLKKIKRHHDMKNGSDYKKWIELNEKYDFTKMKEELQGFKYRPKISILMPVYNVDPRWLKKSVDSVIHQAYENWELCIAEDCSTDPSIRDILAAYEKKDLRIKVVYRKENGHISEASNSALAIASGEYVGLLDNDDELAPFALYEVINLLNQERDVDLIYSDEDKINESGRRSTPFFKSDWAPDTLLSINYICHFSVYKKSIMDEIQGFRKGFEGAQDYDLVLRFTEKTKNIYHIPKILYHWRAIRGSTALAPSDKDYAYKSGIKSVQEALERRGIAGTVSHGEFPGIYTIDYAIKDEKKLSIIIPTRDSGEDVKTCVNSIFEKTVYSNFEIVIADNGSLEEETFEIFKELKEKYTKQFKVVRIDIPFNYARINNIAVKEATGDYLLFLNNDIEVISRGWLKKMVGFVKQEHVGAVGAKLFYPDDTIQHAGVVLGMGGAAGHIHYGFPKDDLGYFGKLVLTGNYLAVTGACLMLKREDFEKVNGFDEEYTVAFNDVDLCLKLYGIGKYNVWVHDAELYHYESKSRGYEETYEQQTRFNKEIARLRNNWMNYIVHDPFYNPNLTRRHSDFSIKTEEK